MSGDFDFAGTNVNSFHSIFIYRRCLANRMSNLTFALLKPEVVLFPHLCVQVVKKVIDEGFLILNARRLLLSAEDVSRFYAEHHGKFFYSRLYNHMRSGPAIAMILANDVVEPVDRFTTTAALWRQLLGETKVYRSIYTLPDSIRGLYGLTDTRNCAHGSANRLDTVREELDIFFPDVDTNFYKQKWNICRNGALTFDEILSLIITSSEEKARFIVENDNV